MNMDTGDSNPIKMPTYRAPLNKRVVIDNAVDEMLKSGIINRSWSPCRFSVVIVDKKDGWKSFRIDFGNQVTQKNSYPLPVIDCILTLLGKYTYLTFINLRTGYW